MLELYKWVNAAEGVSHTGVLISAEGDSVVLLTKFGEMTIPKTADDKFTPATLEEYNQVEAPVVVTTTQKKETKTSIAKSAIARLTAAGHTKEQIIAHLMLLLNISKSNASIYYSK
jgi:hypothetical protein